jgi:peroxiredoxin
VRISPSTVAAACFLLLAATPLVHVPTDPEPSRESPSLPSAGTEPPITVLMIGDFAPDVTWQGPTARPQRLRDLRAQGHVLLVFSPTEAQLQALERDRERLLDLGVLPAAVLDRGARNTSNLARRLGLHYPLIPDPRRIIAAQFSTLEAATGRPMPAWFVVDRWGRVRDLDRSGAPAEGFARLASGALVLPSPGMALPGSTR